MIVEVSQRSRLAVASILSAAIASGVTAAILTREGDRADVAEARLAAREAGNGQANLLSVHHLRDNIWLARYSDGLCATIHMDDYTVDGDGVAIVSCDDG